MQHVYGLEHLQGKACTAVLTSVVFVKAVVVVLVVVVVYYCSCY